MRIFLVQVQVHLSSLPHNFFLAGWHFFPRLISCGVLGFFPCLDVKRLGLWAKLPLTLKEKGYDQECNFSAFSYGHCSSAFKICLCRTWNLAFSWTDCFYVSFKLTTIYIFNNKFFQILMNFVFFQWKRNKQMQRSCLFFKSRLGSLERKKEHISQKLWWKTFLKANVLNNLHTACVKLNRIHSVYVAWY